MHNINRTRCTFIGLMLVLLFHNAARAELFFWDPAVGGNGNYYELVLPNTADGNWSWHDANLLAQQSSFAGVDGHLLTITSFGEDEFVRQTFEDMLKIDKPTFAWGDQGDPGDLAWIGLTDEVVEGQWQWVTGETFSYNNWLPPEPNGGTSENYVHLLSRDYNDGFGERWGWNDSHGRAMQNDPAGPRRQGYFVEYETGLSEPVPEPASLVAFGIGSGILFICKRRKKRGEEKAF